MLISKKIKQKPISASSNATNFHNNEKVMRERITIHIGFQPFAISHQLRHQCLDSEFQRVEDQVAELKQN